MSIIKVEPTFFIYSYKLRFVRRI